MAKTTRLSKLEIKDGKYITIINCSMWIAVKFWLLCKLTGTKNKKYGIKF
jgi:predicted transcriptional regulator of viral defense system